MRKLAAAVMACAVAIPLTTSTRASSHREAPLISQDPLADNTDVYAFVSPERPDRVVLISNFVPLQFPSSGPNFWKFDDNVLYEIMIDNTGDAVEDITYQFQFRTEVRNPNTFLYNTGPVSSPDDPDLNVRQFYNLTRVVGPRRTGTSTLLAANLFVLPANIGRSSIRDYNGQLGSGVHTVIPHDLRVFAGPREEGFYVDLGATFDLLQLRTLVNGLGSPTALLASTYTRSPLSCRFRPSRATGCVRQVLPIRTRRSVCGRRPAAGAPRPGVRRDRRTRAIGFRCRVSVTRSSTKS